MLGSVPTSRMVYGSGDQRQSTHMPQSALVVFCGARL